MRVAHALIKISSENSCHARDLVERKLSKFFELSETFLIRMSDFFFVNFFMNFIKNLFAIFYFGVFLFEIIDFF